MQPKVIVTCAVTGAGDTVGKSPHVPVTPAQIAAAALEAADAGATVVHCHVRDPNTGKGARQVPLYREVMERIRAKNTNVIINLTAGMGGDVVIGDGEKPLEFGAGTDCVGPLERLVHVKELKPEICTLDCGTLNFGDGQSIVVQTPTQLRQQAALIKSYGVKPEMEIFDSGNLWFANQLVKAHHSTNCALASPGERHLIRRLWLIRNRSCHPAPSGRPSALAEIKWQVSRRPCSWVVTFVSG
jgi:uncharacterized protein (DUF849 family)